VLPIMAHSSGTDMYVLWRDRKPAILTMGLSAAVASPPSQR
jgi:hypothetical protein